MRCMFNNARGVAALGPRWWRKRCSTPLRLRASFMSTRICVSGTRREDSRSSRTMQARRTACSVEGSHNPTRRGRPNSCLQLTDGTSLGMRAELRLHHDIGSIAEGDTTMNTQHAKLPSVDETEITVEPH